MNELEDTRAALKALVEALGNADELMISTGDSAENGKPVRSVYVEIDVDADVLNNARSLVGLPLIVE